MKKTLVSLLTVILLLGSLTIPVFAGEDKKITLRIEGNKGTLFDSECKVSGKTVTDVLKEIDTLEESISLSITESQYGNYLAGVNDEKEKAFGGTDGWQFLINGEMAAMGMDYTEVKNGDSIVLCYGDYTIQRPVADYTDIANGVIKFTSTDTIYDENWNASTVVNPVSGALVKWYMNDKDFVSYTTDDKGEIRIKDEDLAAGFHRLQIEKYNEAGLTEVLRFAKTEGVKVNKTQSQIPENDDTFVGAGDKAFAIPVAVLVLAVCGGAIVFIKKRAYEKKYF